MGDLPTSPLTSFPVTQRLHSFVLIALSGNWPHLLIPEMFHYICISQLFPDIFLEGISLQWIVLLNVKVILF